MGVVPGMGNVILYYCRSRGIPKNIATSLLINSFFSDILEKINDKDYLSLINDSLKKWLEANNFLKQICLNGIKEKYGPLTSQIQDRLEYELKVIKEMGYAGYFLITQDFVNYAKQNSIPVGPGRGSAAGSLVAYSAGITKVFLLEYLS